MNYLKPGYSKAVIDANIRAMVKVGHPYGNASRWAMNAARKTWMELNPGADLPVHLTAKGYTTNPAEYSTVTGAPKDKNPVRSLKIPPGEMAEIRRNAQKQLTGKGASVRRSGAAYAAFTGHDDPHVQKIAVPDLPESVWELGLCDGILYTTIRDGVTEKYVHNFKSKSRPLLTVSDDGKQLFLLGGAFRVTERGIEDI